MRDALLGILLGVVFGFLVAMCVIDDMDRFTIPFTDKTFERVDSPPQSTENGD